MKRISINFYDAAGWQKSRRGLALLSIGAVMFGACLWYGWQAYVERAHWNAELAAFSQAPVGAPMRSDEGDAGLGAQWESANQIIARLNTPWAELFSALEAAYSEDAVLLSVEPDPESRQVRLTAESKNTDSMLAFVRQLRASKVLADAYVASHSVNEQDVQRPVRFAVVSHWLDLPPMPVTATSEDRADKAGTGAGSKP